MRPFVFALALCIGLVLAMPVSSSMAQGDLSAPDLTFCDSVTDIPRTECEALVIFVDATNGLDWTPRIRRGDTPTPSDWYGLTVSGGDVAEISLRNNPFAGTNKLTGPVPSELGNLDNLTVLNLRYNNFSGPIPAAFGGMDSLIGLQLMNNDFDGELPVELSNLNLEVSPVALNHLSPEVLVTYSVTPVPVLVAPVNGALLTTRMPTVEWQAIAGLTQFNLQVDNSSDFSSPIINTNRTGTSFRLPFPGLGQGEWFWRMRVQVPDGTWGSWSEVWSFTVDTVPPAAPTLTSPANEFNTSDSTPTFMWDAVADANNYEIQIDTNPYFNTPNLVYGAPNVAQFTPGAPLVDQPWYWRVRATDEAGNTGAWSAVWKLYVDAEPTPVPTLLDPPDGTLTNDRTPTFDWSDETGVVRYNIRLDDDPLFGSPRFNMYPLVSTYTPVFTPLADGTWHWQVRALGADGNWGNWSAAWDLTIDGTRPGRPTPTDPVTGSTITDNTPTFMWTNPGDGASYHVQVDVNPFFRSPNRVDGYSNSTGWTPGTPLDDGKWYWRVQATDAAGNTGAWSMVSGVFIDAIETPVPDLVAPAGNLLTRDRVFTFDWTDEAGVKRYNIQVNTASDFTGAMRINVNPVASEFRNSAIPLGNGVWYWRVRAQGTDNIWGNWSEVRIIKVDLLRPGHPVLTTPGFNEMVGTNTPTFGWLGDADAVEYVLQIDHNIYFRSADLKHYAGITTTSYTIPDLLQDGPWYWRVAAKDAAGNVSFWSANSRIFVNAVPTPVPTLIGPANALLIGSPVYLFDWADEEGVDLYNIQVYSTPDFTIGKRVNANPVASEFFNSPRPLFSGTWYWRVRARGTDGIWGDFSEVRSLEVDLVKPSPPTLVSPAHNATLADSTPTFTWNAVADADVVGYIIQIDKNYFFASPDLVQEQVAGTTYTPGAPLADRRWFWRVAAVDAAGNRSAWSRFWSVIVDTTSTSNGQVIQATSPQVQRTGQWQRYNLSGGSYLASGGASAALSLTFTGSQIEVRFAKHSTLGTFVIEIDGQVVQTVNSRTPNALTLAQVTIPLTPGEHTVRIVTVTKSVVIDAFVITP